MASYHLSVKTISRSAGRSATAAAAYRSGERIEDTRTGEIHDYRRKTGVALRHLVLPDDAPAWAADRAALWNAAEAAEGRKNSTVAREFEIALPAELNPTERAALALSLARAITARHGCAVDVSVHAPGKEGDTRNHHAHLLLTTRRLGPEGFTEKTRELDAQATGPGLVTHWREVFAKLQNAGLRMTGSAERVDHRGLAEQGETRAPTQHLGPATVAIERKEARASRKREDYARQPAAPAVARVSVQPPAAVVAAWNAQRAALESDYRRRAHGLDRRLGQQLDAIDGHKRQHRAAKPAEPTGLAGLFQRGAYDQALTTWSTTAGRLAAWAQRREADLVRRLKKVREYLSPTYPKAEVDAERKLRHRQPDVGARVVEARAVLKAEQVKARAEAQARRPVRSRDLER